MEKIQFLLTQCNQFPLRTMFNVVRTAFIRWR